MVANARGGIAVLAGGTGGHIYPALAVAQELARRGHDIHWFGTDRGLEARVVPAAGFPLNILPAQGLRGRGRVARLRAIGPLLRSLGRAWWLMRRLRPRCALGMGGYVSGPAAIAARLTGVPLVIHEQNAVAGTTNRLLRRVASAVLCAYPNPFPAGACTEVGNPVRRELLDRGRRAVEDYAPGRALRLLVLGGSQGAAAINRVVPAALALLAGEVAVAVRHQTGAAHLDTVRRDYSDCGVDDGSVDDGASRAPQLSKRNGGAAPRPSPSLETLGSEAQRQREAPSATPPSAETVPFIDDMAAAYSWADLVLCRAGALTIAELTVMARPAILVPLPHAIDGHQLRNAQWLVGRGAARLLAQASLTPESLAAELRGLVAHPARLAAMAAAARAAARPDATRAVADVCEGVGHGH